MNYKNPFKTISLIVLLGMLITACTAEKPIDPSELDKIKLEITERSEHPIGILYTIKLSNHSKHTIKQNNVYLSYPIKMVNGYRGNEFKVEAKENKLDIKPNEEIILTAFTPKEEYENNDNLLITECYLEIQGYIEEVEAANHFGKTIGNAF
ncbi:hypothetical protein [Cohnella terricola]|uniref:Intracellular proteinase inhibitor BsuPI domain-containing protein n=1 Tax=Cohnella terricola TaxID=1289167 RepID=A0A559IV59_9BACL|nr:hypothetical protein [Cohnella terricola]TVX91514.1 hypothetical protein FPZ45_24915 [Cohnella terricola]